MYLCVCKAVSERTARRALDDGEVVSLRDLARRYGVGTRCGKCVPDARTLIARNSTARVRPASRGGLSVATA